MGPGNRVAGRERVWEGRRERERERGILRDEEREEEEVGKGGRKEVG